MSFVKDHQISEFADRLKSQSHGLNIIGGMNIEHEKYDDGGMMEVDAELRQPDFTALVVAEMKQHAFHYDHISSMNDFYDRGLKQIIEEVFKVDSAGIKNKRVGIEGADEFESFDVYAKFENPQLRNPHKGTVPLFPAQCRLENLSYSGELCVSIVGRISAKRKQSDVKVVREFSEKNVKIGKMPVMIKSSRCNLYRQSDEVLKNLDEDVRDNGAYFILRGNEWAIDKSENLAPNKFHCYLNNFGREIARGTFQSVAGKGGYSNSHYMEIRYLTSEEITIKIVTSKTDKLEIPFYVIFRLFGIQRDDEITKYIIYDIENLDDETLQMMNILQKAFNVKNADFGKVHSEIDQLKIVEVLADKLNELAKSQNYKKNIEATRYVNEDVFKMLDKFILPHIGDTPDKRIEKMKFLGHMINKLLKVAIGTLNSTDRDAYHEKRVYSAQQFGKTFKTQYNIFVIQEVRKAIIEALNSAPFSSIEIGNIIKNAIKTDKLEDALEKCIKTGDETMTIGSIEVSNRLHTQMVYRKNDLNVLSISGNIIVHGASTAAKASERAKDVRSVHPSYQGIVCLVQSKETGEDVGLTKQTACTAFIFPESDSGILKETLLADSRVVHVDNIDMPQIKREKLTKIFINGDWIGCVKNPAEFVRHYRAARRHGDIDAFTTISTEIMTKEINFWTDSGRMGRFLIIVYNNFDEYVAAAKAKKPIKFRQWIKLTKEHVAKILGGKITCEDLRREQVLEYITADEQRNLFLAMSYDELLRHSGDVTRKYTHCDIPETSLGIVAISAPNMHHTQAQRTTIVTAQMKQASGPSLNWFNRMDKNVVHQYICERPLVLSIGNLVTLSNTQTVMLAYMTSGYNQEDSLQLNASAIDRGKFQALHFQYYSTELYEGEQFGNPDFNRTVGRKPNYVYEYVEDGFIKPGTIVHKNYVLVVKSANLPKGSGDYLYADKSLIYTDDWPAYVNRVIRPKTSGDGFIVKIQLITLRPLRIGDKMASRSGCKGIVSLRVDQCEMPYTEDGMRADMLINPHSIPTRLVIGQVIEGMMGVLATKMGCLLNGFAFLNKDMEGMLAEMSEKYGIKYGGHRRMFNPQNGNWFNSLIFIAPTSYQRLIKFVLDESYAMFVGPTSAITRQPIAGKNQGGGLRLGEMEKDVFVAHGAMRALYEKFYQDSDGAEISLCRVCGNLAAVNEAENIRKCIGCGANGDIVTVPSSFAAVNLMHKIRALGIDMKMFPDPYTFKK